MKLQELAEQALSVQDATNIIGVAGDFAKALVELRKHCNSSDEVAFHPITILWICKLTSLSEFSSSTLQHYIEVKQMSDNTD